uniref:Uncharacterized protein n=1 Tax=Pygocentrus nattereri TaxID=42514 RepID=A0A3B4D4P0_PYGNA
LEVTGSSCVPDRGGVPPSTAVRINVISCCCSRSSSFSSTSSLYLPLSIFDRTFKAKCSFVC